MRISVMKKKCPVILTWSITRITIKKKKKQRKKRNDGDTQKIVTSDNPCLSASCPLARSILVTMTSGSGLRLMMIVTFMHVVYCLTLQITTGWTFFFKDKQVCFFLLWIGLCWFGGGNVVGWLVELELEHPQPHTGLPVPVCVRCARCVRCVRCVWVWTHCRYLGI